MLLVYPLPPVFWSTSGELCMLNMHSMSPGRMLPLEARLVIEPSPTTT
jgi:hypothetical protein